MSQAGWNKAVIKAVHLVGVFWFLKGYLSKSQRVIENVVVLGINLNGKNIYGETAFHLACQGAHSNVIKMFMENAATLGIDLNSQDGHNIFSWRM